MANHGEATARALAFNEATNELAEALSNEKTLRANDYPQDRGLFRRGGADNLNHVDFFGECYLQALQSLGENDVWLHIGPGDFNAEVDYFTSPLFSAHAKVISNAYCVSTSPEAIANLDVLEPYKRQGRFSCIDGVKFQELTNFITDRPMVISDVFAAGSYDADLFGFFRVASEFLLPGGMLAVVLESVSFSSDEGKPIAPVELYQRLPGFELINCTENSGWVFRRMPQPFVTPKAELTSFVARDRAKGIMWPIRRYKMM